MVADDVSFPPSFLSVALPQGAACSYLGPKYILAGCSLQKVEQGACGLGVMRAFCLRACVGRFHETAQDPEYRDGEAVEQEFPTAGQLKHLKRLFEQGDTDASGTLSKQELAKVLKNADGMAGESTLSDDEIEMISWQVRDKAPSDRQPGRAAPVAVRCCDVLLAVRAASCMCASGRVRVLDAFRSARRTALLPNGAHV